jgi:ADP-ribose pyrophosphatase YjhB (NUDIX family)
MSDERDVRAQVLGALRRPDSGEWLVQWLPATDPTAADVDGVADPTDGRPGFHRFVGGGIRFGEGSDEAVEREFREELAVEVEAGPTLCTVENLFSYDGEPGHELVVVREVSFVHPGAYDRDRFSGVDAGGAVEYEAYWQSLAELRATEEPLYPEGIALLLSDAVGGRGEAGSEGGAGGEGIGHLVADELRGGDGSD